MFRTVGALVSAEEARHFGTLPKEDLMRAEYVAKVKHRHENGTLRLTDLLAAPEPGKSFMLEWLDGVDVANHVPRRSDTRVAINPPGERVLIIHRRPEGIISVPMRKKVPVWGSTEVREQTVYERRVGQCYVTERWPDCTARLLLFQHGITRGEDHADLHEWFWLDDHVKSEGPWGEGLRELHAEALTRPGLRKLLGLDGDESAAKRKS